MYDKELIKWLKMRLHFNNHNGLNSNQFALKVADTDLRLIEARLQMLVHAPYFGFSRAWESDVAVYTLTDEGTKAVMEYSDKPESAA